VFYWFFHLFQGIGHFTVVDGQNVSTRDLGNNFFVEKTSVRFFALPFDGDLGRSLLL